MPNIIVGTAGHIDHGKTALVKALTGIDADRLKEEKERGITIDIGFASLAVDAGTTISFVDVPGHERFIKNMLAGVGGVDAVLLVVAADESVMPQTREHLDICSLLRIPAGIVVLTKIDAADHDLTDLAEVEVREFVRGTFLEGAPLVRVSSRSGQGLPALRHELARLAARVPPKDASRPFRLPIDRAFTSKGFGTVVSGTVIAGRVQREEEVEILPSGRRARVRGVQVHGTAVDAASAGQRAALNLQRVDLGDVARGMVLTVPGVYSGTSICDVRLELLAAAPAPMRRRQRVRLHVGTLEVMAQVVLLGQDELRPGEHAFAQLRLERSASALPGDRFIVRQYSPMLTIGGGEILDPHPPRHRPSDPTIGPRLRILADAPLEERVLALTEEAGTRATDLPALCRRTGLSADALRGAIAVLAEAQRVRVIGDQPLTAVTAATFEATLAAVARGVERFHAEEPLAKGIGREELKARSGPAGSPLLFRAALDALTAVGRLSIDGDLVTLAGRTIQLGEDERRTRETVVGRLRDLGLQAPGVDELIAGTPVPPAVARKILKLLLDEQVAVKVAEDTLVHRDALQKLVDAVRGLKATTPTFGVREFKALTGLSRKFAVPLLEYLDAQRVTRRVGDERIIL